MISSLARYCRQWFRLSWLFMCLSFPLYAQTTSTTILGTVADASGAILPGAKVTVTNTRTAVSRETATSSTGDFSFPLLDVGVYEVTEIGRAHV